MITADKTFLRSHYKKKRLSLTKQEVDDLSQRVCKQLDKLNIWKLKHYHIFISILKYNELDTSSIINKLKSEQKIIIVPKISNNELVHIAINDETEFGLNEYGIKEPNDGNHFIIENLDIIFIPLLAFDIEGHRVGYGKGYYDRFLKLTNNSTLKIGLSFFDPINKILDIDDNDVKLDYCVTPKQVHKFNNL
ncbi:MAG: 5-formyltetrahydrofolate cyclo-ligase [Flavobacteriaceae bacterium]